MAKILSAAIAILALAIITSAPHSTAHAKRLIELNHAFLSCAGKADAEQLERLLRAASKANGGAEAIVAYGNTHCLQLRRGIRFEFELGEGAYGCVHHPPEISLSVPSALVGFLAIVPRAFFDAIEIHRLRKAHRRVDQQSAPTVGSSTYGGIARHIRPPSAAAGTKSASAR